MNVDHIAMCYISMDSSQQALQTNEKLFSNFELVFKILTENQKIFKIIERSEYWSNCNVYVSMDSSNWALQTNEKFLFNFNFVFELAICQKTKNIQSAWILIEVQCIILYQWIRLNMLFKLTESFFFNFRIQFWICGRKPKKFQKNRELWI